MKKLEHCVYVLKSHADGNLYIGYTTDLHRRLKYLLTDAMLDNAVLKDALSQHSLTPAVSTLYLPH